MDRMYYAINENAAKLANDMSSFSDYEAGSATAAYHNEVNAVYDVVEKIARKNPDLLDRAKNMADKYSRKLASYHNSYYSNAASCPSVLISGGANFPTKKKQKQNERLDTLMAEWEYLEDYRRKIEHLLYMNPPILSDDARAIEKLEQKLEKLKQNQEDMKVVNAYYRKNKTLDGCPMLSEKQIEDVKESMESGYEAEKPFPTWCLTNNNKNIHATEARLEKLKAEKATEGKETEYEGFTVVENKDNMRLQILFDKKPAGGIRDLLKSNGFHWSPREEAWQRQLTENARRTMRQILPELEKAC